MGPKPADHLTPGTSVTVEGCAGWRYVAEELAAAGIAAHLGEPADTAALRGRKRHAKTDKTDARHLRALHTSVPDEAPCSAATMPNASRERCPGCRPFPGA